jgi:hypothetical protein
MTPTVGDVNIRRLDNVTMTIKVSLSREFRLRLAVGLWFIKLGAWIAPFRVNVEEIDR